MRVIRFTTDEAPQTGVLVGTAVHPVDSTIADLLRLSAAEMSARLEAAVRADNQISLDDVRLLAPVDGWTEVWAAGVTYKRSRDERMAESDSSADVYERVYDAERPELFFKASAWRVQGPGETIGIRSDCGITVPETELAVVVNAAGEIVGYTICNDVSSRDIEGENPLYLPQAKVYDGSCAVGPAIVTVDEVPDPKNLPLLARITRGGETVWAGEATTADLVRNLDDLVDFLRRELHLPYGAVLSTGTCLVPDLPFTLVEGDEVHITVEPIGELMNPVALASSIQRKEPA